MAKRPTNQPREASRNPEAMHSLDARTRRAMTRKENAREEWWMVRNDGDPKGVWSFTLDPYASPWDWKVKIGANKHHVERRIAIAKRDSDNKGKLLAIRALVDKIRSAPK
jgi:hypothetical protein